MTSSSAALPYVAGSPIVVAFVVEPAAELVDIAGAWGVFEYARSEHDGASPFRLVTVSSASGPIAISGGLRVVPDHSLETAPRANVVIVPALGIDTAPPGLLDWLRRSSRTADVTMSVCNGAFVLAEAGLLDGRRATCHHGAYGTMRALYPAVDVVRGVRYVEDGPIATAGGLTSGTDLALRIVERYLGEAAAARAAVDLEHLGDGWRDPSVNAVFARPRAPGPGQRIDPVCEHPVDVASALVVSWDGVEHHFCCAWCRDTFAASPARFVGPASAPGR